jgi:RND family efflux transporter MFP subunit
MGLLHKVGFAAAIISPFWLGCQLKTPPPLLQSVNVDTVRAYAPDTGQRFAISIMSVASVDLVFKCAGPIARILQIKGEDGRLRAVGVGDQVKAGTELASVRTSEYQQKVEQTRAALDEAKAQLQAAKAVESEAESQYERAKLLYQTASISKPNFEHVEEQHSSAMASRQSAEAAVANAQSVVEQAQLVLHDTAIYAPFTGWITSRDIELGTLVVGGSRGFGMVDTHLVKAAFGVSDRVMQGIKLGQHQTVVIDALEDPVQGAVTAVSQIADPKSLLFRVELTISNPANLLHPGMVGSVTLGSAEDSRPRLVIPLGALVRSLRGSDDFAVWLLDTRSGKNFVRLQEVRVGKAFGSVIEVLQGLGAGQQIVTNGSQFLGNGEEVRVLQ